MRLLLAVLLVVFTVGYSMAAEDKRLEVLTNLHDLNEAAIAYHRFCVGDQARPDAIFVQNAQLVSVELRKVLMKQFPDKTAEEIERGIFNRGNLMQGQLSEFYKSGDCKSEQALAAKQYYGRISAILPGNMISFIEQKTAQKQE